MLVVPRHVVAVPSPATDNPVRLTVDERHFVRHPPSGIEDSVDSRSFNELTGVQYLAGGIADNQRTVPKAVLFESLAVDDAVFEDRAMGAVGDSVDVLLLGPRVCAVTV